MQSRRTFLAGLAAMGSLPSPSWADVGSPDWISAAKTVDGNYALVGVTALGEVKFQQPLPDRGHDIALHPHKPHAVGFARRPGNFARVLDCRTGEVLAEMHTPTGRHFYGHGAFIHGGATLLTAENEYEAARGIIGIWDVTKNYKRIGEFASGGVGPHDLALLPDRKTLVIANGGIETHPESGRTKLNLPMMRPNLTYIDLNGALLDQMELPRDLHYNSIRHLDVDSQGNVAFAMQWEGPMSKSPALLGRHKMGQDPILMQAPPALHKHMNNYAGSVAITQDETQVAITSPRGGIIHVFDWDTQNFAHQFELTDVCGVAAGAAGFHVSAGTGKVGLIGKDGFDFCVPTQFAWDNHMVSLPS